jgi:hypothetical protein
MKQPLMFSLAATVAIIASGESGSVVGRAEYLASEPSYLLRYRAADGRAVERWWPESALREASSNVTRSPEPGEIKAPPLAGQLAEAVNR